MSEADAQLEGPSKRAKTAGDVAASEEHSPWQEPEHLILNRIIQTLMGLEEGPRWVSAARGEPPGRPCLTFESPRSQAHSHR